MTAFGSIDPGSAGVVVFVESAAPDDLASRANAAIAAIPAGNLISDITLAGGGDGHTFVVLIEYGPTADVDAGLDPATTSVKCYMAAQQQALAAVRSVLAMTLGGIVADEQMAGGSKGTHFMGLLVLSTVAFRRCGLLQVGYDQPIEGLELPPAVGALFPRDVAGNPLRVTIPGVTPGNTLEVDMRFNIGAFQGAYDDPDFFFAALAVATFDGSTVFPGVFQAIVDSAASEAAAAQEESVHSLSSLAAVAIPAGATTAVVQVIYVASQQIHVAGANKKDIADGFFSATLKVSEICKSATAQLGPGVLGPLIGP